jgi:hypothetical protein
MEDAADIKLKQMARSLREHIRQANELNLGFVAQLLAMAVMEITINRHGISHHEIDALCERIEDNSRHDAKPATLLVPGWRGHDRRSRVRRSRIQ